MDAVTFGGVRAPTLTVVEIKPRKSFFARFVDALRNRDAWRLADSLKGTRTCCHQINPEA
jgi:hypothetical protein